MSATKNQDHIESTTCEHHDPLLENLLCMTKLLEMPQKKESLVAGLPLEDNKLTPSLFLRAAHRAGISAQLMKFKLSKITPDHCPAVALLEDNKACILLAISEESVDVIKPQIGEGVITLSREDFLEQYTGYAFQCQKKVDLDQYTNGDSSNKKHWFWGVIKKAWPLYSEVLVASLLINLFAISVPLFVMNVYDRVVPNNATSTLWVLAVGMFIVIGFEFLMRSLRSYFIDIAGKKIDTRLSASTFEQIIGIKMKDRPKSVGFLSNMVQAFESFRELLTSSTVTLLVDVPFVLLFLLVIGFIHPSLVSVPLVIIPTIVLATLLLQKPLAKFVSKAYRYGATKQALLLESIAGAETIKALCAEGYRQRQWENTVNEGAQLSIKIRFLVNFASHFAVSMQYLATITLVIVGVYAIGHGELTVGGLIAASILMGRCLAPILQSASILMRYHQSKTSLDTLDTLMQLPSERQSSREYLNTQQSSGDIQFQSVCFTYPDQPNPALTEIDCHIRSGEHVGLIGRNGSGKSTIEKMILNLYQPDKGRILIDGLDINQIDPAALRKQIAYIPQEVVLFQGSIRDNITFGSPHADDASILHAAELSGVSDFVYLHPDGFNRQVGENGAYLSGGQRKCIAIARALLQNPNLFIVDEPTTALDNESSAKLMQVLNTITQDKTLILISHKSSTLALVDRLILLDRGRIVMDNKKSVVVDFLKKQSQQSKTTANNQPVETATQ